MSTRRREGGEELGRMNVDRAFPFPFRITFQNDGQAHVSIKNIKNVRQIDRPNLKATLQPG